MELLVRSALSVPSEVRTVSFPWMRCRNSAFSRPHMLLSSGVRPVDRFRLSHVPAVTSFTETLSTICGMTFWTQMIGSAATPTILRSQKRRSARMTSVEHSVGQLSKTGPSFSFHMRGFVFGFLKPYLPQFPTLVRRTRSHGSLQCPPCSPL